MNKICSKCKSEKPIEEFGKSTESKDGLKHSCKSCRNRESMAYRKTHRIRCYTPAVGTTKKCDICKREKAIEEFGKDCCQKDGRERRCKTCIRKFQKERYAILSLKNISNTKAHKICSMCHKDKLIEDFYKINAKANGSPYCKACWRETRMDKWRNNETYKNKLLIYGKKYNLTHTKEKSEYNTCYSRNPENKRARAVRVSSRIKTDLNFKIRCRLGTALRKAVRRQSASKSDHTMVLTGCSIEFLKKHIENQFTDGMTWDNYGKKGWSIDHIKPCAAFNLTKPEEQRACFHYSNLRPLWEPDNVKKSSWYNGKLHRIKNLTSSDNTI